MIWGSKTLAILELAMKLLAPCAARWLERTEWEPIKNMPPEKRSVLVGLLKALNKDDSSAKAALKAAAAEVQKIQGV